MSESTTVAITLVVILIIITGGLLVIADARLSSSTCRGVIESSVDGPIMTRPAKQDEVGHV